MGFSIATFNVKDLFDDEPPHVIGHLDAELYTEVERSRARKLYRAKLEAIAAMVRRLDADVIAFQEIKNARVLDDLRALLPERQGAPAGGYHPAVAAAPDRRGIACGLLSRFPVLEHRDHQVVGLDFPVFVIGDPHPFPSRLRTHRGVLEATVALPDGTRLVVMVVHLKSKRPTPLERVDGTEVPFSDHRSYAEGAIRSLVNRLAEALFVRRLVDERLDVDPAVQLAVAGDFNDDESSLAVRTVMGEIVHAGVVPLDEEQQAFSDRWRGRVLYPCARAVPSDQRYSLVFRGSVQQVDHVLVSPALWARFRGARFLNETLHEDNASPGADGVGPLASDHAPLRADFE